MFVLIKGRVLTLNHLLLFPCLSMNALNISVCFLVLHSAIRTWHPLREVTHRLQYILCAAVLGKHVPVSGK